MPEPRPTRGFGLLEGFLAGQRSRTADRLIPSGHRKNRILDIGCGTHPVFLLKTQFNEKYGLDKVVGHFTSPELENRNIRLINCELKTECLIPFDDEFFSVITMLAVVEHLEPERLIELFREIHRVLVAEGILIMTTPAAWTDALLRLMAKLRLVSRVEIEEHKDSYAPSRLCSLLEQAGFTRDRMRHGYFEMFANTWILAEK
jgi:SAM-dependent methyltransferase